jgi:DnaJ like chaperone protein
MSLNRKLLWGGLGWAFGGPIGAILGFAFASLGDEKSNHWLNNGKNNTRRSNTKPADFVICILVLCAKVMKADGKLLKSELDYIKEFLIQQFGLSQTKELMPILKDILDQDYPLKDVCRQIQRSMDHPSRLQLVHVLFGLSAADGHVHQNEIQIIFTISNYLNINQNDFESIKSMFFDNEDSAYKILEISPKASDSELKKAFRKMANKYHPDKVSHLGEKMQTLAEEKFKAVNDAYQKIKKERGI